MLSSMACALGSGLPTSPGSASVVDPGVQLCPNSKKHGLRQRRPVKSTGLTAPGAAARPALSVAGRLTRSQTPQVVRPGTHGGDRSGSINSIDQCAAVLVYEDISTGNMPHPVALVVAENVLKVLTGFVLGYMARDLTGKQHHARAAAPKHSAAAKKPLAVARPKEELKMVLCVNDALKMGKGKIGAQCAHAAVGVVQKYRTKQEVAFRQWEMGGQAKIALRIQDENEMDQLAEAASAAGMPTYIVYDAGRTQIPAGSQTVLAIGPAPKSSVDKITGHLKLL